jgi:hypothetical protein
MKQYLVLFVLCLSLALNAAFAAVWVAKTQPAVAAAAEGSAIRCPLHRDIGVTAKQWEVIAPRLFEFQRSLDAPIEKADRLREEVLATIAEEGVAPETIHAKQRELLDAKHEIQRKVAQFLLWEKTVLTPEQQERMFALLKTGTYARRHAPPLSGRRAECGLDRRPN